MAADVVMLNLWAHDVGRADGQAYSVLRSVFEEAVRLYDGQDGGGGGGGHGDGDGDAAGNLAGQDGAPVGGPARFPKVKRGGGNGGGAGCVVFSFFAGVWNVFCFVFFLVNVMFCVWAAWLVDGGGVCGRCSFGCCFASCFCLEGHLRVI